MPSRTALIPSVVPGFVLLVAALGQMKEQLSVIALVLGTSVIPWALGLFAILVFQVVRKADYGSVLVGLALSIVAATALALLALDTPLWVRWRAAPAIHAIEELRSVDGHYPTVGSLEGDFPRSLRTTLTASGHCIYKPRGDSYHLACLSIPFSKSGYDGATGRWTGWE